MTHYETSYINRYDDYDDGYDDEYDDRYEDDRYDNQYDDRYDDDYDSDDYNKANVRGKNDDEDVNPGMTKIIKTLTAVVTAILIFVLIFIGVKATGLLKFNGGTTSTVKEKDESMTKMPDIIGKKQDEAIKLLNEAGLGYQTPVKTEESEKYEKGLVIRADFKTGEDVKKNTRIALTVSSGLKGAKIPMPALTDYTVEDAINELVRLGLKEGNITPQLEFNDHVENGKIIKTDPPANSETTKDAKVTLYVSKGKEQVSVPDLRGKDQKEAEELLKEKGLKVGNVTPDYSNKPEGTVIEQSITEGEKVDKNTAVDLVVSQGERPKQKPKVPDIVGNSQANVESLLRNAGLVMVIGGYEYNDEYGAGIVIRCEPGERTEVEEGASITVIISKGPNPQEPTEPEGPSEPDAEAESVE